jgi:hypothetical protein
MEGLSFNFDNYEVQALSPEDAREHREQANEVLPLLPDGLSLEDPDPLLYSDPLATTTSQQGNHLSYREDPSSDEDDDDDVLEDGGRDPEEDPDGMVCSM